MTCTINTLAPQKNSAAPTRGHPVKKKGLLALLQDRHYISSYSAHTIGKPLRKNYPVAFVQFDKAHTRDQGTKLNAHKSLRLAQSSSMPVRLWRRLYSSIKSLCLRAHAAPELKVSALQMR